MNAFKLRHALLIVVSLIACALSGCASITASAPGNVHVETHDGNGSRVVGADCVLRNSKGEWRLVTPGGVPVAGANDDLVVRCDAANHEPGQASVVSTAKSEMVGNIIFGGLIGAMIDHTSGAGYEYPSLLRIKMGDTIVIQPPRNRGASPQRHARPELLPARTDWAAIEDEAAVPTRESGRQSYRRFLTASYPRALAIGAGGRVAWSSNNPDAAEEALRRCQGDRKVACQLYAIDNFVVWSQSAAGKLGVPAKPVSPTMSLPPRLAAAPRHSDPSLLPPRTDWAAVSNIDSLPIASRRGRDAYRVFLALPMPRAFAIGPNGTWAAAGGRGDAISATLTKCQPAKDMLSCRLYAVDDYVAWSDVAATAILAATWMPQSADEPEMKAGSLADVAAVPFLNDRGRESYRTFLEKRSPRAFALSASGAFGWSYMRDDAPERALQYCQKSSRQPCRLYVVDEHVVWPLARTAD